MTNASSAAMEHNPSLSTLRISPGVVYHRSNSMTHVSIRNIFSMAVTFLLVAPASSFSVRSVVIQKPVQVTGCFHSAAANRVAHVAGAAQMTRSFMTPSDLSNPSQKNSIKTPLDRPLLATLDFVSILLFALIGTASHASEGIDLLAVGAVAFPFLVSWFLLSPFVGLYSAEATANKLGALSYAARGWILAVPMGCVLRGVIKGYVPPLPFVVVTMIATLVLIGGTRVAYTALNKN